MKRKFILSGTVPPPSKKALLWKEFGVSDFLLHNPSVPFLSQDLALLLSSNLDTDSSDDVPVDTTILDLEEQDAEVPRGGVADVTETTVNESIIQPPSSPSDRNVPPQPDMPLEDERDGDDHPPPRGSGDFIDNIDMEADGLSRIIPDMPDLEGDMDRDNKEGGASTAATQSTTEQQNSKATDKFEQRRLTRRAQQVLNMLEKGFSNSDKILFSSLAKRCLRKQAASRFYTCLLLGKEGAIKFEQNKPFSAIEITQGPLYAQSV